MKKVERSIGKLIEVAGQLCYLLFHGLLFQIGFKAIDKSVGYIYIFEDDQFLVSFRDNRSSSNICINSISSISSKPRVMSGYCKLWIKMLNRFM